MKNGVSPDTRDDTGGTALMITSFNDTVECAQLLIAHGAKVNAVDNTGKSPLEYAADYSAGKVARLLLKKGAKIEKKKNIKEFLNNIKKETDGRRSASGPGR